MGIYDRDYYKNREGGSSWKRRIFKFSGYFVVFLFLMAFVVYMLAVFSEK